MIRRLAVWTVFVILASATLPPVPALATNYCGEQDHGIWLIQDLKRGYGSWAEVQKVNDSLVKCTSGAQDGRAGAWHTVGVRLSADGADFLEVGISRDVACPFCTVQSRVFGEYGFYPSVLGPFWYDTYNPDGGTVDMKVTNVPGTWDWNLYWDKSGGGLNWIFLDRFDGLSSQVGWLGRTTLDGGKPGRAASTTTTTSCSRIRTATGRT